MDRKQITAAVIEEADRLLAEGIDHAVIATQLGLTEYVVDVIAGDTIGRGRKQPPQKHIRRVTNAQRGIDATTIRMIQRMLAVSWLSSGEIAREARVSRSVVERVAAGKRPAVNTGRPIVFKDLGERFLHKPIRCPGCHGMISIVPCRACRARKGESFQDLNRADEE